jgi:hypothetical protein
VSRHRKDGALPLRKPVMATQLAEMGLPDPPMACETVGRPRTVCDGEVAEDDDRPAVARGIVVAALISTPLWALVVFTLYLVL